MDADAKKVEKCEEENRKGVEDIAKTKEDIAVEEAKQVKEDQAVEEAKEVKEDTTPDETSPKVIESQKDEDIKVTPDKDNKDDETTPSIVEDKKDEETKPTQDEDNKVSVDETTEGQKDDEIKSPLDEVEGKKDEDKSTLDEVEGKKEDEDKSTLDEVDSQKDDEIKPTPVEDNKATLDEVTPTTEEDKPIEVDSAKETPKEDELKEEQEEISRTRSIETTEENQKEEVKIEEIVEVSSTEEIKEIPKEEEIIIKEDESAPIEEVELTARAISSEQEESTINKEESIEEEETETRPQQPITRDGREIDPEILKRLENYLDEKGITNYELKFEPGTVAGENTLSIIAKIKVTGTDPNGSNVEYDWIAKIAPPIEILRKAIKIDSLYKNEVLIYESVLPAYQELEHERSITNEFRSYPDYLFSSLENLKELVVMSDMKSIGYISKNPKEPLDLEHVKIVMKAYGKLHALSYALKEKKPEIFEKLSWVCRSNLINAVDVNEVRKNQEEIIQNTLTSLDQVKHGVAYRKFSRFVQNFMSIYVEASRTTNQYSVIGHGDSWINNMLFKYENPSHPNQPTAVCLIDFQISRYASPVCDLSYFIFTCTDKAFRDEHYDNAIKLYYYSLCTHLTDLGCDPEKILPFDALEAELKHFSVVGLYMSLLALMAMIRDADEIGDWQVSDDIEENAKITAAKSRNQEVYDQRVRDMVLDFVQKGYLDFI